MKISTLAEEGIYQASKWLKLQLLIDQDELASLFQQMGSFEIYPLTGLMELRDVPSSKQRFLDEYGAWIEGMKRGIIPTDEQIRRILACAWSSDPNCLWLQSVPGGKYLVKIAQPVVQVQAHSFTYSEADGVFRPLSMGLNAVFWGIQISYPQIYQDPKTMELLEVADSSNSELFKTIRQWVRDETRATPFVVGEKRTNVPIRLGKKCFSWVGVHPQLKKQGISVYGC